MTPAVMIQHVSQEVNHLVRSNPLLIQGKQEVSSSADRRKGGDSSPFSSDLALGRLSARRPRLAQECRQRNVCLVLKIENRPVFPHCFAYFGQRVFQPLLACLLVCLEVLAFRFLVRQSRFAKPSPNSVLRHNDVQFRLHDLMYPCYGPQVCLIAELRRRLKNEVPEPVTVYVLQLPGASTSGLPVQPEFSALLIPSYPSKKSSAVCAVRPRHVANGEALTEHSLHSSRPNLIRRVYSMTHGDKLSRHTLSESRPMLQIYCGGPYVWYLPVAMMHSAI